MMAVGERETVSCDGKQEGRHGMAVESSNGETRKPTRLSRTTIYESPWVNLHLDRVQYPAGLIVEEFPLLDFEMEAVATVVEDGDGRVLMIQSYRYPTDSIEWEIPAGGIDEGESAVHAAAREVLEETGYRVEPPRLVYTYNPMNGLANKVFHVTKAKALERVGEIDLNEVKDVRWCTIAEIREMIASQSISDGFALTALLLHMLEAR